MFASLLGIYPYNKGKNDQNQVKKELLSPPLPLLKFDSSSLPIEHPQTISGEILKSIPNKLENLSNYKAEKIFDPILARKLSKYFIARSQKEVNWKQVEQYSKHFQSSNSNGDDGKVELFEYVVYESLLYVESKGEREERNTRRIPEYQIYLNRQQQADEANEGNNIRRTSSFGLIGSSSADNDDNGNGLLNSVCFSPSIQFDSEFESGNLEKASRVIGRETLMTEKALDHLTDYALPSEVDQEYDLTLRNDINTDGNIQWYYFSVQVDEEMNGMPIQFPLKVRFNIINMMKKDSLYNYGMRPCIYSCSTGEETDWFNGGYDICYYKNGLTSYKTGKKNKTILRNQYTFTFTYTFERPDTVCFAYTYPYTYSDLRRYLLKLETDPRTSNLVHRRKLCETLAGNRCDVITITERTGDPVESKYKPGIVISGRIHPGESNSSFIVQGLIEFLLSDAFEAIRLRKTFIFTIVPMLNPGIYLNPFSIFVSQLFLRWCNSWQLPLFACRY